MSEETLCVAVVGAPHGVRGEVRVTSFTAVPRAFASYGPLTVGRGPAMLKVEQIRIQGDKLIARFEGVTDRDAAARLTNQQLYVPRGKLPVLKAEDEFYHTDLIGLAVVNAAGDVLGRIVSVDDFGAGDLLEIAPEGAPSFYLPFTKACVPVVDVAGGRVVAELPDEVRGEEP